MKYKIFFSGLFLIALMSFTCGEDFKILSSTYENWNGGVKGVRGKIYTIKLKTIKKENIEFKNLIVLGVKYPLQISDSAGVYSLRSIYTENKNQNNEDDPNKEIYLEYLKNKKAKKILIKNWKFKPKTFNPDDALIQ